METFHCSACQALVFFENTQCLVCGRRLAYLPGLASIAALETVDDCNWQRVNGDELSANRYKLCLNYTQFNVCNWAIPVDDPEALCRSCRLTSVIPNLGSAHSQEAWAKLETAKRRLVYGLLDLNLPLLNKRQDAVGGLEFQFLSDGIGANGDRSRVLTGHDNGLITINVAEADDIHRETQRQRHHEPYRTLLGHFRHEIGHYYWDRLIGNSDQLKDYRRIFGDESADYQAALKQHYQTGAPPNWADRYISAYASTHPWEDWAETWAHVMHMIDALETSRSLGLSITPPRADEPTLTPSSDTPRAQLQHFDRLLEEWISLTYLLNNLSRGLGLADAYPFVLSGVIADKLRFVCSTIDRAAATNARV